jgi:hypothetical protein
MNIEQTKPDYTIDEQYLVEYPIRLLKFILRKLKIKKLFAKHIHDPRSKVSVYALISLLMHGLFTHIFRSPSKHEFQLKLLRPEASVAVAKFNGNSNYCPCTRTVDDVLNNLEPNDFLPILPAIFRSLCRAKVFQLHPELISEGEFGVAIDAHVTHVYYDHSQHPCQTCPYCLKRTHGNKTWYLHMDVVASFVAPNGFQIPLIFHRIQARPEWGQLSENKWKQECERTAFPFLIEELRRQFPRLSFCIHLDSLYATDPNLTLLEDLNMGYSIVRKAKVLKTVGEDCEGLKQFSKPVEVEAENRRFKVSQTIYFFNDIAYRQHSLSIIQLDEYAEKKPSKRFAKVTSRQTHWEWIVRRYLTPTNVSATAAGSRTRWKQENLFNDLQRRGFAICHDFNRAPTAQTVRSYLILIAYAICAILTYSRWGKLILSKGAMTIIHMMTEMLEDLTRIPEEILFKQRDPGQLRWGTDPPAIVVRTINY